MILKRWPGPQNKERIDAFSCDHIFKYNLMLRFHLILTRFPENNFSSVFRSEVLPAVFFPSAPTDSRERSCCSVQSVPQRQQPDADVQRLRPPGSHCQLAVESLEPLCPEQHSEQAVSFFYPDVWTQTHTRAHSPESRLLHLCTNLKHNQIL